LQEWSDLGFEHHVPDVGTGCDPINVDRKWVAVFHSDRGGVDDQVVTLGILRPHGDLHGGVVLADPLGERLRGRRIRIKQADPGQSDARQRGRDR
jgi:hypothetical protein